MAIQKKILYEVRKVMRIRHVSIRTGRSYCSWIKRFILFHRFQSRSELLVGGEKKTEAFLTHLVMEKDVAPATQNLAVNALVFLYEQILKQKLSHAIQALLGHEDLSTTMIYTHAIQQGGHGVTSPLDDLHGSSSSWDPKSR